MMRVGGWLGGVPMLSEVVLGDLFVSWRIVSLLFTDWDAFDTYEIDLALATILHREWECGFETRVLVFDEEESLMWSFGLAILCCCQDDLQGI